MSPATTARCLAGLHVLRGRPTRAQWVEVLKIAARAERTPGCSLEVTFMPGGTARIAEHPLPKVQPA